MPSVPDPGSAGFNPARWAAHLVNAGLRLARKVGFGLGLVNELQAEIPIASQQEIGAAAGIVGAGVRAAVAFRTGDPAAPLDLSTVPVVPSTFFHGDEIDRILSMSDVTFDDKSKGGQQVWNVIVECGEGITMQELEDCIREHFRDSIFQNYPEILEFVVNEQINLYFLGKRF